MVKENFNLNFNMLLEVVEKSQKNVVVFLTCSLSLFFSVLFWLSFGQERFECAMLVLMAIALEGTKLTSLSQLRGGKKIVSLFVFLILSAVSVVSSSVVLQERVFEQTKRTNSQDWFQQEMKKEIEQRKAKINLLSQSASKDIEKGFRARANETLQLISLEEGEIAKLRLNLKSETSGSGSKLNLVFSFLGNERTGNEERFLIVFLGTLLELCTSYLLLSVGREHGRVQLQEQGQVRSRERSGTKKSQVQKNVPEKNRSSGTKVSQVQSQEHRNNVAPGTKRSEKIVPLVLVKNSLSKGECKPTTRSIKQHFSVGTDKARGLLVDLVSEGVLILEGNRYQLCS